MAEVRPIADRHALDAPAVPENRLGAQRTIVETIWMRLWQDLAAELCSLNAAMQSGELDLGEMPRLAVVVKPGSPTKSSIGQLRSFCQGLLRPLVDDALRRLDPDNHGLHAVLGWQVYLQGGDLPEVAENIRLNHPHVYAALDAVKNKSVPQELTARMWRTGNPNALVGRAVPELRRIALTFFDALDDLEDAATLVARVDDDEARRVLREVLLPPKLAFALDRDVGSGKEVTAANFDPIITGVQNRAFSRLERVIGDRESMLVLGPPGCGKTRVGQVAAAYAVHSARQQGQFAQALVLVPTKTMVRENHRRWLDWAAMDEAPWRVVAGSADDREYDEALAQGDYDVGICVYEKLASLIYGRSDVLNRVRLIVVDELQNLGHRQRGLNLEALLTILRIVNSEVPIIGLSATLSRESTRTLRRWLKIKHLVVTQSRPVDVGVHVVDGATRRSRLIPAARPGEDDSAPPMPSEEETVPEQLEPVPDAWPRPFVQRAKGFGGTLPILLIRNLLADKSVSDRRILWFVKDRRRARDLAKMMAAALEADDPEPRLPKGAKPWKLNPWKYGRYANGLDLSDEQRTRRFEEFLWTENHRWRGDVLDGFLNGVTYHTRTLQTHLRHRIEDEFDSGLVRVLVCTETLAEGVNLSASDVIVADLTQYNPRARAEEVVSVAQVKNRLGRAGRLGKTEARGNAYIVIDPRYPRNRLADPSELPVITELDAAWDHWIEQTAPEEGLRSELGDPLAGHDNLCGLVLRALAVDQRQLSREEMVAQIESVIAQTYWAVWGGQADPEDLLQTLEAEELMEVMTRPLRPAEANGDAIVETLLDERLVGPVAEEATELQPTKRGVTPTSQQPERLQVTKLGMSIARSALPLGSSLSIRNLATAAQGGVGAHSLQFLAAQDPAVQQAMHGRWLSWSKPVSQLPGRDQVMRHIQSYVALYGHPNPNLRRMLAESESYWRISVPSEDSREFEIISPDPDLVTLDPEPVHPDLRRWVTTKRLIEDPTADGYDNEKSVAVAAFRGTVAHEWANFQKFRDIAARLDSIYQQHRPNRKGKVVQPEQAIPYSVTDIEQLGERIGYVLGAAGDFLEGTPDVQARLDSLGQETTTGVPTWLAPLARLRIEGLGRERLIEIHRSGRGPVDDLEEALRWDEVSLPPEVRQRAIDAYQQSRLRAAAGYTAFPGDLENRTVPSTDRQYSDLWKGFIDPPDVATLKEIVDDVLFLHLIPAHVECEGEVVVAKLQSGADALALVVYPGDFDRQALTELLDRIPEGIAVPLKPPAHGIEVELTRPGARARAIKPGALMKLLYGLRIDHSQDLDGKLIQVLRSHLGFMGSGEIVRMLESLRLAAPVELDDLGDLLAE